MSNQPLTNLNFFCVWVAVVLGVAIAGATATVQFAKASQSNRIATDMDYDVATENESNKGFICFYKMMEDSNTTIKYYYCYNSKSIEEST